MRKLLLIILGIAILSFTASISVLAWDHCQGHGFWKALNLTADQQQKISSILKDSRVNIKPLRKDLFSKMKELRQLWKADTLDQSKINAKTEEIIGLRIKLVTQMRKTRQQVEAILTPDQLKQLQIMQAERQQHRCHHWRHHRRHSDNWMGGFGFDGE